MTFLSNSPGAQDGAQLHFPEPRGSALEVLRSIPKFPPAHLLAIEKGLADANSAVVDRSVALIFEYASDPKKMVPDADLAVAQLARQLGTDKSLGNNVAWACWDMSLHDHRYLAMHRLLTKVGFERTHNVSYSSVPGFFEFSPENQPAYEQVKQTLVGEFRRRGAQCVEVPIVGFRETISAVNPRADLVTLREVSAERGNVFSGMVLSPEHTIGLIRCAEQNPTAFKYPCLTYQLGPVFRAESVRIDDPGRWRGFMQADLDIISDRTMSERIKLKQDAKIIRHLHGILKELGVDEITVRVSNRKILEGALLCHGLNMSQVHCVIMALDTIRSANRKDFGEALPRSLAVLKLSGAQKKSRDGIEFSPSLVNTLWKLRHLQGSASEVVPELKRIGARLEKQGLQLGLQQGLSAYTKGVGELDQVLRQLERFRELRIVGDTSLWRTCPIYSGTEFEMVWNKHPELGAVAAGGRYDRLWKKLGTQRIFGTGGCIGVTRLVSALIEDNMLPPVALADVLVTTKAAFRAEDAAKYDKKIAVASERLRQGGMNVSDPDAEDLHALPEKVAYARANFIPQIYFADTDEWLKVPPAKRRH